MKKFFFIVALITLSLTVASAARLEGVQACSVEEAKSKAPKKVKKKKTVTMRGYIQDGSRKDRITMTLIFWPDGGVSGYFYYNKYGPKNYYDLMGGYNDDGKLFFIAGFTDEEGDGWQLGDFTGELSGRTFSGVFSDADNKEMTFYVSY